MKNKPLYQRILATRSFRLREDAEEFVKGMKAQYKDADISIKHDIVRDHNSDWKAIVYAKI
jgi:hypothetical protein